MADFKTHSVLGTGAGLVLAAGSFFFNWLSLPRAIMGAVLFSVASVLPDIDSANGTAKKFLFETLAVLVPGILVTHIPFANAEEAFFTILVLFFTVRYPVRMLFEKFTKHRGIFHSIPAAALFGLLCCQLFCEAPPEVKYFYGGVCAGGYLLHLLIDELWSWGFFGLGVKKSFGTACKLFGDRLIPALLIYLALAALLLLEFCPEAKRVLAESHFFSEWKG